MPELHWPSDHDVKRTDLEAQKALSPFCAGRVVRIFIDPPYNTRSTFEHYDTTSRMASGSR